MSPTRPRIAALLLIACQGAPAGEGLENSDSSPVVEPVGSGAGPLDAPSLTEVDSLANTPSSEDGTTGGNSSVPQRPEPQPNNAGTSSETATEEALGAGGSGGTTGNAGEEGSSSPPGGGGATTETPITAGGTASSQDGGSLPDGNIAGGPDGSDSDAPPEAERCNVGVYDGMPPQTLQLSGDTFAHDPTLLEEDGVFYRFWTGNDIPSASSTDLRTWRNAAPVYQNGYPSWVENWLNENPDNTFNFPWAPDISYFGGRYHLYSSFSAFFGRNTSCITHLSTESIASGEWTDHGPVICTDGTQDYNAIDADVSLDATGTPWLAFGSFWGGIYAFELSQSGERVGEELAHLAWAREIEAPVLFYRCGYYYLFVTWGLCCPGEGRSVADLSYRVAVGRSESITGPYVDRDGVPMLDGGGTLLLQGDGVNFAAAGHSDVLVSGETVYHLYHAYRQPSGDATLRITELPFDDAGWPVPGGP